MAMIAAKIEKMLSGTNTENFQSKKSVLKE